MGNGSIDLRGVTALLLGVHPTAQGTARLVSRFRETARQCLGTRPPRGEERYGRWQSQECSELKHQLLQQEERRDAPTRRRGWVVVVGLLGVFRSAPVSQPKRSPSFGACEVGLGIPFRVFQLAPGVEGRMTFKVIKALESG